ncbi:acyltransferase [bacterium]|nr:acyltransferase [bacterium]
MRIAGLDGLRALAIVLVLGQHLHMGGWISRFQPDLGRLGVALFFALSGYLITGILCDSKPSLATFYWRRSLRIFPAFYTYWLTLLSLALLGLQSLSPLAMLAAATYWINWLPEARGWSLQHLWSLAVEEQFYVMWPLILKLAGRRGAERLIWACFLGWPMQRWWRRGSFGHPDLDQALVSVTYDALLWGCLLALWQRQQGNRLFRMAAAGRAGWIPWAVVMGLYFRWLEPPVVWVPYLRNACLAWIVAWVASNPRHWLTRGLHLRPMRWLGTRSYSLYLWHPLFMLPSLRAFLTWPMAVAAALVLAELSYRWIESPVLAWRDRGLKGRP